MLIIPITNIAGSDIIEKNKSRRSLITQNITEGANNLINKLYNTSNINEFKEILINEVLYEELHNDFIKMIYGRLSKDQFLNWYNQRGQEGCWDLIKTYKLYKY